MQDQQTNTPTDEREGALPAGGREAATPMARIYVAVPCRLTRSHLTDAELSNPSEVRTQRLVRGRQLARIVELRSGWRKSSQANAASRKAHRPVTRHYEGFEGAGIEEYQSLESVAEIAEFISEHGALAGKLIEYIGQRLDEASAAIED